MRKHWREVQYGKWDMWWYAILVLVYFSAACSSTEPSPCQVRDSSQYTTQDGYVVTVQLEVC